MFFKPLGPSIAAFRWNLLPEYEVKPGLEPSVNVILKLFYSKSLCHS